jgi:prepilin-type N-terminal cleavage/methylation domain-containing protein/prepilin-type processing-associated H-X9-DG protein
MLTQNKSRSGFTLIELLVVIAIIAILAAILFPVFAQAKAAAKKTAALSNAKEIVLGAIMYSNDYDDVSVPYFSYLGHGTGPGCTSGYCSGPPGQYWPQLLSTYISKAQGTGGPGHDQALAQNLSGVFFDPIETVYQEPSNGYGNETSWGISDDFINWYGPHTVTATLLPATFSQVSAPSSNVYFVETWGGFLNSNYPGEAEALSVFDLNNYTYTPSSATGALPGAVTIASGYVGTPGCANCWNGAHKTTLAPYNSAYQKTTNHQLADPAGMNNVGFADGHVKTIHVSALTTGAQALTYWSISGTNAWP